VAASRVQTIGKVGFTTTGAATNVDQTITPASNVTAGDTIFIVFLYNGGSGSATFTVSDSAGNSYTHDFSLTVSGNIAFHVWRCSNCLALTTSQHITIHLTNGSYVLLQAIAEEWSGLVSSSPLDQSAHATGTTATSMASGSTSTTTHVSDLVLGLFGWFGTNNTATTASHGTGFTAGDLQDGAPASGTNGDGGVFTEYAVVTTTGAQSAAATLARAESNWIAVCAVYKIQVVDNPEALSSAPTVLNSLGRTLGLFRAPQTVPGPATILSIEQRNAGVGLTTSVSPSTAVAAQQALSRAPASSVPPSTIVGRNAVAKLATAVAPSTLVAAAKFGVSQLFPTVQFLVDWTNTGTFVDESAYVREIQIARGRAAVNDVFGAGTATVILRNESGRFGPYNPASPLYPNVIGARPFKLTTTFQGILYPEFVGYTNEYTVTEKLPKPEATISGIDAFDPMSRSKATIALQTGQTTDSIIRAILTAYGWTGLERLDVGRILPYYAQIGKTVLQALQEVSQNELGGAIFMGKDGAVVFQNAGHRAAQSSSYTLNGGIEDMNLGLRQSDLIDSVRITYGSYSLTTTTQNLYTGNINRQLPAQQYTTFTDYITSAQPSSIVTPVPYTDYTANDGTAYIPYTGGGNLDVTNSVWLETFSVSGGKFTATFYNSLPYTVQLSSFGIRGLGLVSVNNPPVYEVDVGSPQVENQAYELTVGFVTDIIAIAAFATARANALGSQHPRPVITVVGRSASLMAFILGCDLSQRITLTDTAAPWLSQLNADFFIEHINLSIIPGQIPTAQLTLFDTSQGIPA
jgi:hypothetical protein